jgi:cerevisin
MKGIAGLTLLPLLAAAKPVIKADTFGHQSINSDAAPLISSVDAETIPDSYLIAFKDHVDHRDAAAHHNWVQDIHEQTLNSKLELRKRSQAPFLETVFDGLKHTYNMEGLKGYSGHFDESVIEAIRKHPDVSTHDLTISPSFCPQSCTRQLGNTIQLVSGRFPPFFDGFSNCCLRSPAPFGLPELR